MKDTRLETIPNKTKKPKSKKMLASILGVLVVTGAAGGGYFVGLKQGEKRGAELVTRKITDTLNPLNLLSTNPIFPSSAIGKITKLDSSSLTVQLANGDEKTIGINEKTQVTQQSNTLKVSDLKQDQQVTVFIKKDGNQETASRILVR